MKRLFLDEVYEFIASHPDHLPPREPDDGFISPPRHFRRVDLPDPRPDYSYGLALLDSDIEASQGDNVPLETQTLVDSTYFWLPELPSFRPFNYSPSELWQDQTSTPSLW